MYAKCNCNLTLICMMYPNESRHHNLEIIVDFTSFIPHWDLHNRLETAVRQMAVDDLIFCLGETNLALK